MTNVQGNKYLLQLAADLSRDPGLRDRIAKDPSAVIEEYGISSEAQAILRTRDTDQIVGEIAREAREIIARVRDQRPIVMMPWPTNQPTITPPLSPSESSVSTPISVTVHGTLFSNKATLLFSIPGATVNASNVVVNTNSEGQSTMTAMVSFPTAGVYDVAVANPRGGRATLSAGFTVTDSAKQ